MSDPINLRPPVRPPVPPKREPVSSDSKRGKPGKLSALFNALAIGVVSVGAVVAIGYSVHFVKQGPCRNDPDGAECALRNAKLAEHQVAMHMEQIRVLDRADGKTLSYYRPMGRVGVYYDIAKLSEASGCLEVVPQEKVLADVAALAPEIRRASDQAIRALQASPRACRSFKPSV